MVASLWIVGCQETETPLKEESALVIDESLTDYYFSDVDDMTGVAVDGISETETGVSGGKANTGGRTITDQLDDRFGECAVITVELEGSTGDHPKGTITIDFGDGCTDPYGNVRKGKIIIHFDGRKFHPGSVIITMFEDYSINNIALEGVRTLTNLTTSIEEAPKFEVKLEDGKATDLETGLFITRSHCFTKEWHRANNPLLDELHVLTDLCPDWAVHAFGTMRNGQEYNMVILETLVYRRRCPIAVSGKKQFTVGDRTIIVDYGTGECDRSVIISVDGKTRDFNVR